MSANDDVRAASDAFYRALTAYLNGNPQPMQALWWTGEDVTTGHPIGAWARGREAVLATWSTLADTYESGGVSVEDMSIHVHGDIAYTIGVEHVQLVMSGKRIEFTSPVTNIYKRDGNRWMVIHHHVDRAPNMQEAVLS